MDESNCKEDEDLGHEARRALPGRLRAARLPDPPRRPGIRARRSLPVTKPSVSNWHRSWRDRLVLCARRLHEEARLPKGRTLGLLLLFALGLLWAYAPTLAGMVRRWSNDPQYSHGFLVPVFAGIVLWVRRAQHPGVSFKPSWGGVPWLLFALVLRLAAAAFYLEWLDALS